MTIQKNSAWARMRSAVRAYATGWKTVDPAVALGLFGTGVGMALPVALPPRD